MNVTISGPAYSPTTAEAATEVKLNAKPDAAASQTAARFSEETLKLLTNIYERLPLNPSEFKLNALPVRRSGADGTEYVFVNLTNKENGKNVIYVLNAKRTDTSKGDETSWIAGSGCLPISPQKLPLYCERHGLEPPLWA